MPRHPNAPNRNGHRRRQLVARIKATSTHCALCGQPLATEAQWPDPLCTVIDEDIPRVKGGSPLDPDNCAAMHNQCNRFKSTMTLTEARQALAKGADVTKPMSRKSKQQLFQHNIGQWEPSSTIW